MRITHIVSMFASVTLMAVAFGQNQSPAAAPGDTVVAAPETTAPPPAKAKAPAKKQKAGNSSYPFRGKLKVFDKDAMTFTVAGKDKDRVIRITSQTRFAKDGKPATLSDAVIDGEVAGTVRKGVDGKEEAVSVRFGAAPKAEKPTGKSAPKKETTKPAQPETK